MEARSTLALVAMVLVSMLAHVLVFAGLGLLPPLEVMIANASTISIDVVPPEPELIDPEPEPEPEAEEPEPELEPEPIVERPEPRLREPPPEDAPPPEEPPPAEETVADFTGETLTNEDGPAWNSAVGNGAAIDAPIGRPGAEVTGRSRRGVAEGTVGGTGDPDAPVIVPVADLSRAPSFDEGRLRTLVRDAYPRRLRDLGIEGVARVRIRVRADGRVQPLAVVTESDEGFGEACRRSLRAAGRFDPPLDRAGRQVDTITTFRCAFTLSD
jgi:protein TonB